MKISVEENFEVPDWDVAIEALINEVSAIKGQGLKLGDFKDLATKYFMRFDDIMKTVFELCIHEHWQYIDENNQEITFTQETLDSLYVDARLREKDLIQFQGRWHQISDS